MNIKERIQDLCLKKGITAKELEEQFDLGKGYISKIDKGQPNISKIKPIALYLDTTLDYLIMGKEPEIPNFEFEHIEMIELYSKLSDSKKKLVMDMLKALNE